MTRSESRELAFAIGFERIFNKESVDEIIEGAVEARDEKVPAFTEKLAKGAEANESEIDALIEKNMSSWKIDRVSKAALAVLRLCVYELLFEKDIPNGASINEAVELAKKYGDTDDFRFVNAVLANINRSLSAEPAVSEEPEKAL